MDVLKLGIQMIKNIEGLHTLGYVHRDIKPDNILVELDKKARIYDHQVIDIDYEIREHVQRGRLKTNSNHPYHNELWIPSNIFLIDFGTSYQYKTTNI